MSKVMVMMIVVLMRMAGVLVLTIYELQCAALVLRIESHLRC